MDYFYKDYINLLDSCPPTDYKIKECVTYRWVFDDIMDERNFKSQADKNPKPLNSKNDFDKCEYYALSFHDSSENSRKHFNILSKKFKNIQKNLGTKIARGNLGILDGKGGECDKIGHFNFHHIKNNNFVEVFNIIESL